MNFTNEQMNKAKSAKTAEELLAMAKEAGIEMTEDEAAKYFAELNKQGELTDDELTSVAGGSKGTPDPLFQVNDRVRRVYNYGVSNGSNSSWRGRIDEVSYYDETYGWQYMVDWDEHALSEWSESSLMPEYLNR